MNDYYKIIQQPIRELFIKIYLLNSKLKKIDEIQGKATDGSISIDVNSDIRRKCNVSLVITDSSFLIGKDKKIWLDKFVKINIGIKDIRDGNIIYSDQGIYMINQPSISYNLTEKILNFEGLDLMAKLTGNRDGHLENEVELLSGTPIGAAVKSIVTTLGGFEDVIVEDTDRILPYDIEIEPGDTAYSLLSKIRDLYMDFEMFFDENGVFHYQKIKSGINNPVVLDFSQLYRDLTLDISYSCNFENVKNKIIVYGKKLDDGTQVTYTLENTDENSPFNINTSIGTITYVINDDDISDVDQAKSRAEYEFWLHNDLCEELNLTVIPVYFLKGNQKIKYKNVGIEIENDFIIQSLTIPLKFDGQMNIESIAIRY